MLPVIQASGQGEAGKAYKVLFLCTGNSARSIIAEVVMNHLAIGNGKFKAYSAGSHPKDVPNPLALDVLKHSNFSVEGLRSKSWDEFATPGAPPLDFVFTVCDQAAQEACPYWPGQPMTAHWGLPDPAAVEGADEAKRKAFRDTLMVSRRRIEIFVSLPLDKLDKLAIQKKIKEIGTA
ncbi:MAG TPA: arsenate reductase ArsC [Gammaproteobacteria bacterium]|jgi:protein-tyrosine-phosphatase|nr:arsenate reductase ArsC [Gammaproteobacteria bacterium]